MSKDYKMTLPIDKRIAHQFQYIAKLQNTNATAVMRGLIDKYIADHLAKGGG